MQLGDTVAATAAWGVLLNTLLLAGPASGASTPGTSTSLTVTSGGSMVTTVVSGNVVTLTATVNTTAASTTALVRPFRWNRWKFGGEAAVLATVLMLGMPSRRRRWLPMLALLSVVVLCRSNWLRRERGLRHHVSHWLQYQGNHSGQLHLHRSWKRYHQFEDHNFGKRQRHCAVKDDTDHA